MPDKGLNLHASNVAETVFEYDCLDTVNIGSFSGMWYIYAVSSVLQTPIHSIYLEFNFKYRNGFHKLVFPRETHRYEFVIMWTHAADYYKGQKPQLWSPNHFVPCILRDLMHKNEGKIYEPSNQLYEYNASYSMKSILSTQPSSAEINVTKSTSKKRCSSEVKFVECSHTLDQCCNEVMNAEHCHIETKDTNSILMKRIAFVQLPKIYSPVKSPQCNQMKTTSFISHTSDSPCTVSPVVQLQASAKVCPQSPPIGCTKSTCLGSVKTCEVNKQPSMLSIALALLPRGDD